MSYVVYETNSSASVSQNLNHQRDYLSFVWPCMYVHRCSTRYTQAMMLCTDGSPRRVSRATPSREGVAPRCCYVIWLGIDSFLPQMYISWSVFQPGNEARIDLAPSADKR